MKYSVALTEQLNEKLLKHLLRDDGQEDAIFCVWNPSVGKERSSALVFEAIPPLGGERLIDGNVTVSQEYFLRALGIAVEKNAGLVLMHSHVGPGWQSMSRDDEESERYFAQRAFAVTDLPLLGMTAGTDGTWSARFWIRAKKNKYDKCWCESVRVVGSALKVYFNNRLKPNPAFRTEFARTVSAWGEDAQFHLMRLKIGVVGVGGAGSIVAEALARMGVMNISLIDFDSVEKVNLDRLLHATLKDAKEGAAKVTVIARALEKSSPAGKFAVEAYEQSVTEPEGFRRALDCDILFSCVDRPWPRFALNFIAYAHVIPVVDGGVLISVNSQKRLKKANFGAHIAAPSRRCLSCLEQYDPGLVATEREGLLEDPNYIKGLADDSPLRRNENVFAFNLGAAALEILQFLMLVVSPLGISNIGSHIFDFISGTLNNNYKGCEPNCPFPKLIARGDRSGFEVTGKHLAAETARQKRSRRKKNKAS